MYRASQGDYRKQGQRVKVLFIQPDYGRNKNYSYLYQHFVCFSCSLCCHAGLFVINSALLLIHKMSLSQPKICRNQTCFLVLKL